VALPSYSTVKRRLPAYGTTWTDTAAALAAGTVVPAWVWVLS
jgi:hypothetical protein